MVRNDLVLPISARGIVGPPGKIVLLRNERDAWEFPGGRLEVKDESPPMTLQREITEQLDVVVDVQDPVHAWRDEPTPGQQVLLIAYTCDIVGEFPEHLWQHDDRSGIRLFDFEQLPDIDLGPGYRQALQLANRN